MLFHLTLLSFLPAGLAKPASPPPGRLSPLHSSTPSTTIPGRYIVKFRDDVSTLAMDQTVARHKPDYVYSSPGFAGFAAALDTAALKEVRGLPYVEFVEQDLVVTISGTVTQNGAPWNLARISSRTLGSTEYRYDDTAGAGTCVYIIDTGVDGSHPQLSGRVIPGISTVDNKTTDGNGHGTAVAGVAAGIIHGVAKKATIIAVRVLTDSGSGTTSGVIQGMSFVATDSQSRNCPNGTVANMSLGGAKSAAMNSAAAGLVNSGVFLTAAAGGSADDAAYYSPASEPLVFTVGATDMEDSISWSSNYGPLVDLFAPGVDIIVPWIGGGTNVLSGSSFSCAHAAGLGAYLLGLHPNMSPVDLGEYMQEIATKDVIKNLPPGTKNLLAYNGIDL